MPTWPDTYHEPHYGVMSTDQIADDILLELHFADDDARHGDESAPGIKKVEVKHNQS